MTQDTPLDELVSNGVRHWGRFSARPVSVNPLDEYLGVTRRLKKLRLKEWVGWTLMHPEMSSSMILQDANYLASSEIYVRDASTGRLTEHARNARGGSFHLPEVLNPSAPALHAKGYDIEYTLGPVGGTHTIKVRVDATDDQLGISMDLSLDGTHASAPLSVSHPLTPKGAIYTHKTIFPASGTVTVGDKTYTFDPSRDVIIIDEHKSFFPYNTFWLWGTFAHQTPNGIVGANFCERAIPPGSEDESCIWVPATDGTPECLGLNEITFTQSSDDPLSPWTAQSADGRLDVTFTADGRKNVKHQLVVFGIDYFQMYGTYTGKVGSATVDGVRGVLESFKARL